MSELWIPGMPAGPQEEFVARLHRQIERFARDRQLEQAVVEIELRDGGRFTVEAISAEPGFGFVTLTPQPEEDEPTQLIVPVGAFSRIELYTEEEKPGAFGFSLPGPAPEAGGS